MSSKRNTEAIVRLAAEKSLQSRQRVLDAIQMLQLQGEPVNFASVCKMAGVSKTFLYDSKHADLADQIRRLRTSPIQPKATAQSVPGKSESAKDVQIARLKDRVQVLERQVRDLQRENELLYGKLANL